MSGGKRIFGVGGTHSLMSSTASSYFIPNSMRASATRTGALPRPATQWTATHASGLSTNWLRTISNHLSITWSQKHNKLLNLVTRTWKPVIDTSEREPIHTYFLRGSLPVREAQVDHLDPVLGKLLWRIRRLADTHQRRHFVPVQQTNTYYIQWTGIHRPSLGRYKPKPRTTW